MIVADLEKSKSIATRLRVLNECGTFPSEISDQCVQFLSTIADPEFPGALIPEARADGSLRVIAAATPSDWRRLRPVLQAFAGPTITSFNGFPVALLDNNGIGAVLSELGPQVTAVMSVPVEAQTRMSALRALIRMRETFARAPQPSKSAPEPTSWLLARFQDHLNIGRRDAAALLLDRLRDELRLDALNLRSLQVQLLATFDDWTAITDLRGFANLAVARKTPAVAALLLEALYQVHLSASFDGDEPQNTERIYSERVRPLALPMLTLPAPSSLRDGGWRLFALEALVSPEREELQPALDARKERLGWLANRLAPIAHQPPPPLSPIDQARELVVASVDSESVDVLAAALAALARLNDEQRLELARAEPFSSALRALEAETTEVDLPTSWLAWLARAADPTFTNALEVARFGAEEWLIADEASDPTYVRALIDGLGAAQADELAAERTFQALPFIVASIKRDPGFPSPALAKVYANLITLLALGASRSGAVYDSSQILIEGLLAAGLDVRDYKALIADVEELAGEGLGVDMIFWTLEVIEAFMRSASPDAAAREELLHRMLARIAGIRTRLSSLQLAAVRRLAGEFGWTSEVLGIATDQVGQDNFATRLGNKKVAIYSLLEGASRQAKVALETAVPSVEVECNADHVGTSRLRALARNSDIFVIAWAAAKHSATEFIREHRGDRTLLYAQGKGFSSLLRALEDHCRLAHRP
jgi:hypothetical protein